MLAKEALELSALALAVRLMEESAGRACAPAHPVPAQTSAIPGASSSGSAVVRQAHHDTSVVGDADVQLEPVPVENASATEPQSPAAMEPATAPQDASSAAEPQLSPLDFVKEGADARTRLYSARDEHGSVYAAFYADGRLRVAFEDHRLAGIVQSGHAHLLDMSTELWSEVFVRVTPEGALQLELRDGPLDGRVLNCEALQT